jgi:hypothetical protein
LSAPRTRHGVLRKNVVFLYGGVEHGANESVALGRNRFTNASFEPFGAPLPNGAGGQLAQLGFTEVRVDVFLSSHRCADLLADLDSGELPPGTRLPSEGALADVYGVSRPTVRRAIAALIEQERLKVVHGRGTYVTQKASD